jgi:hypothetical protein
MHKNNLYKPENPAHDVEAVSRSSWDEMVGSVAQILVGLVLCGMAIALTLAVAYLVISPTLP